MKKKREPARNFNSGFVSDSQNSYYSPPPNLNSRPRSNKPLPCLQESSSSSFNPNTPVRRTVTEKSAVKSDDSGYDSGGDLAVATNKDILVRVLETFTRNNGHSTLALLISSTRGDTNFGREQAAHVTAYRALLEVLMACTEGYDIRESKKLIIAISKKLLPNKSKIFDDILEQINKVESKTLSSAERREFIKTLLQNPNYSKDYIDKLELNLALGRRKQHIDAIELIATSFLREVNLDENIAFRTGLSDSKEGTRVRLAVHALKLLVELIELSANPNLLTPDRIKHFHNSYIRVNAPYKDGIKRLGLSLDCSKFTNGDQVVNTLEFQKLLQQIETSTIASLCGDLFDFKYKNHKFADIEVLFKVLAKHLVIIFTAFDSLRKSHNIDEIIDCFLIEEVLKKEGWGGSPYFLVEGQGVDNKFNSVRVLRSGNFFAGKVSHSEQVEILKKGISKYMDFTNFELNDFSNILDANVAPDSQGIFSSPPSNLNSRPRSNKPLPCLQGSSSSSFNPNTPVRRTVIEKSSSSAVKSDDSGYDSGGDLAVATNKDILVRVLETFTRNNGHSTLALLISSTRGDTNFGREQGAHVTAYRALLEVLMACTEGYDIREAKKLIIAISKKLLPNKSKIFDDILEQINKVESKTLSSAERREFIKTLLQNPNYSKDYIDKLELNLALGRRKQHIDAIELIATLFLREVNLDENIAFRSGLSDSKEGTRVRLAVHALKLLVELIELSANPNLLTPDRIKYFYNSYIGVNAPYKDGIKRLGLSFDCFKFINGDQVRNKLEFQKLLQKIETSTIASLCGDLFDFKYKNHKFADIEVLFKVLAKHLVIIFTAFDSLRKSHNIDEIIDCFLIEEVLKKEGWDENPYFLAERQGVDDQSNNRRVLRSGNFFAGKVSHSKQVEILKKGISKYMDFANFELISINDMMRELSLKKG